MTGGLFGDLTDWVTRVIEAIGYAGVAFLVALESVFPPIPSEVVLPAAGFWAKENGGVLPVVLMVVAATIGSVTGAWILYGVSRAIGRERLIALTARWGKYLGMKVKDIDRAERWFDDREYLAVLVCRCVPLVRSLVSIPAGFSEMPPVRFTVYTAAGSAVWNTALILVGYAASSYQEEVESVIGYVQVVVVILLVGAVGWFLWRRAIQPRLRGEPVGVED
ncbi:DedA family protein [Iamia sp. SCSIO 61187]|uniref:DedA family protein n=1 Tax=Iamia sp. SCSIO 61187 TaxID=2722752 RepID=UPI001C628704|nr:DedA family protein [Iamia sp. SCSIO 61187]QYG91179.1 DedA family protein [Iamia sp. SCSIO 61187]